MERKSPVFPIIILVANFLKVILKFIKISLLALKKKKKFLFLENLLKNKVFCFKAQMECFYGGEKA